MSYLKHAEHHATNSTSLAGLDQNLLFFGPPHITVYDVYTISVFRRSEITQDGRTDEQKRPVIKMRCRI